ncbi:MAG TPA: HD domain-containing protein [Chloroflexota bacterium]|nr:HD domain-containing protein [Chloroflexota bacterium]
MLEFLRAVGVLKTIPRQGWVDRRIPDPESVADHTYRSAMMAWALGQAAGLDTARLVKIVLVHDLPEAEAGDATPYVGIVETGVRVEDAVARWRDLLSPEERAEAKMRKHALEADGLARICASLPGSLGDELLDLWAEYSERRTPEARFAAEIDKLEALLQAIEYRDAGHPADVENFLLSARESVQHPLLVELLAELERYLASRPSRKSEA